MNWGFVVYAVFQELLLLFMYLTVFSYFDSCYCYILKTRKYTCLKEIMLQSSIIGLVVVMFCIAVTAETLLSVQLFVYYSPSSLPLLYVTSIHKC